MCRLFGFRSIIPSQVHRSLIECENALLHQSQEHPDGWGVAYYAQGVPHVIKSAKTAVADKLFRRVSGIVSSETVIAHLRRATVGQLSMINSHPFQYGNWIFAHNGQIPDFGEYREEVIAELSPVLRRFVLGTTDSEVIFFLLLSKMQERVDLTSKNPPLNALVEALDETLERVHEITGQNCYESETEEEMYLSVLLTNGQVMLGHQGGKPLYYSTHKSRCSERDTCPHFAPRCEKAVDSGKVSHMVFSSEPLDGENVWQEMSPGDIIGVDAGMYLHRFRSREAVEVELSTAAAE